MSGYHKKCEIIFRSCFGTCLEKESWEVLQTGFFNESSKIAIFAIVFIYVKDKFWHLATLHNIKLILGASAANKARWVWSLSILFAIQSELWWFVHCGIVKGNWGATIVHDTSRDVINQMSVLIFRTRLKVRRNLCRKQNGNAHTKRSLGTFSGPLACRCPERYWFTAQICDHMIYPVSYLRVRRTNH